MIATLTPTDATEILREHGMKMSPDTLRHGIEQGVYPFGVCIQCDRQPVYQIFAKLFYEWIAERSVDEKETAPLQRERPQVQTPTASITDGPPGVKGAVVTQRGGERCA